MKECNKYGGIVGCANLDSSIKYCYNRGDVNETYNYGAAGICATFGSGSIGSKGEILGCYNTGNINAKGSRIGGITGYMNNVTKVENVVNCGNVFLNSTKATAKIGSSTSYLGTIVGMKGNAPLNNSLEISKDTWKEYSESQLINVLGDMYTKDVQDKDGKYLNDGYPILKWQLQENQVTE